MVMGIIVFYDLEEDSRKIKRVYFLRIEVNKIRVDIKYSCILSKSF